MTYPDFSRETERYDLPNGYALTNVDSTEYGRYWAVYRGINENFVLDYATIAQELAGVPFCYWISHHDKRLGGCIMLPNNIGDMFLIPPFSDWDAVLWAILPLLHHWSDKPIQAQQILEEQVPAMQRMGFRITQSRRFMIRPTDILDEIALDDFTVKLPKSNDTDAIAALFHMAFSTSTDMEYKERSLEQHLQSVNSYFEQLTPDDICHRASALVYENDTLIAASLIQVNKAMPSIRFVAVHPDTQRRGIASRLTKRAITTLHDDYAYVTLAVTDGNPAQALYYQMGFKPTDALYSMVSEG